MYILIWLYELMNTSFLKPLFSSLKDTTHVITPLCCLIACYISLDKYYILAMIMKFAFALKLFLSATISVIIPHTFMIGPPSV